MTTVKNETNGHLETKQDRCSFVLDMAENTSVGALEALHLKRVVAPIT